MYVALSKLALGTHLGGKRKKKPNQNIVRRFIQSQYLWSCNSPGGIHAVSVPQAVPLLPQCFLEFHASESANNFTKAANVPGTCPAHVVHIHCPEGSKLMLKNKFPQYHLVILTLLRRPICKSSSMGRNAQICDERAKRAKMWVLPSIFVVLSGGGFPGLELLTGNFWPHLPMVAGSTTCLHCKNWY